MATVPSLRAEPGIGWDYPGILRADGKYETGPVRVQATIAVPLPRIEDDDIDAFTVAACAQLAAVIRAGFGTRKVVEALDAEEDVERLKHKAQRAATDFALKVGARP